jgi:hypothetical protein
MTKFVVNIATPETPSELKLITDFIELHGRANVLVSNAYPGVVEALAENKPWLRPGFKFCFWFADEALAHKFMTAVAPFTKSTCEACT